MKHRTRQRLHYQSILVFRLNRQKRDSQNIMTFGKHHNPTMFGINKRSCNLFMAGLAFYNHSTLKGSLI